MIFNDKSFLSLNWNKFLGRDSIDVELGLYIKSVKIKVISHKCNRVSFFFVSPSSIPNMEEDVEGKDGKWVKDETNLGRGSISLTGIV